MTAENRDTRILVAEDEFLVYLMLEEELRANGYTILGPCGTLAAARMTLAHERVDLVLLDVNMGGEMAWPLADELLSRNIPFIFLSGYGADVLPPRLRETARIGKPYHPAELLNEIRRLLPK
jgi:two-component system, response regulator PdtaR